MDHEHGCCGTRGNWGGQVSGPPATLLRKFLVLLPQREIKVKQTFMLLIAALGLVVVVGCSGGIKIGQVSGEVTLDGEPLRGIVVNFQSQGHSPSYAITNGEGKYKLEYKAGVEGAVVGTQEVYLAQLRSDEMEELPPDVKKPSQFPSKFLEVFQTIEVESGRNVFDFHLTSN